MIFYCKYIEKKVVLKAEHSVTNDISSTKAFVQGGGLKAPPPPWKKGLSFAGSQCEIGSEGH